MAKEGEVDKTVEPVDVGFKAVFLMDTHQVPVEIKSTEAFRVGKEAFHIKNNHARIRFVRVLQFAQKQGANLASIPAPLTRFMKSTQLKLDELYIRNWTD